MKTEHILLGAAALALYFFSKKKPAKKIEILKTDSKAKSVTYRINYLGKSFTDTFFVGDKINKNLLSGNIFAAAYDSGLNTVSVGIGITTPEGGFKSTVAETVISF